MTFKEIREILEEKGFYGFTVKRGATPHQLSYTYHSISNYAVNIVVDTIRLEKEKIVARVKIGNITIDDEKELIPTLNGVNKIHNVIIYGNKKNKKDYGKLKAN